MKPDDLYKRIIERLDYLDGLNKAASKPPWSIPHMAREDVDCNCNFILSGEQCGSVCEFRYTGMGDPLEEHDPDFPTVEAAKANMQLVPELRNMAPSMIDQFREIASKAISGRDEYFYALDYAKHPDTENLVKLYEDTTVLPYLNAVARAIGVEVEG